MATNILTPQQKKFVHNLAVGMLQTHAARAAGYAHPSIQAVQMLRNPKIIAAVGREQKKYEAKADMTRQKVLDGLKDAIEIARLQADATGMVAGWREIARICGYYAPETKKIELTVSGAVQLSQIEDMSDEQLSQLVLEGECARVDDEDDEEIPLLEAPTEEMNG